MQISQIALALFLLASSTQATAIFKARQSSCTETCGSTCYSQSDINAALNQGYSYYQSGNEAGDYPHTYNDYEKFTFPVDGPYQEFPILSSEEVYSGGSPGPDRVIFNEQGQYAGLITHTGASGDNFVECTSS